MLEKLRHITEANTKQIREEPEHPPDHLVLNGSLTESSVTSIRSSGHQVIQLYTGSSQTAQK
jgi:hypothetical protein